MDAYEATRVVFSRIQNLDPENASRIMGYLLIQDHGEKELIRLAFGPETLVHSVILKARKELGLQNQILPNSPSLSSSSPSTPSSPSPFLAKQNSSSRLVNNGFNLPSPLSIPNSSSSANPSWTNFSHVQNQDEMCNPSQPGLPLNSKSMPFYGGNSSDIMDEFQLQDQLSFLTDNNNQDLFYQQQDLASSPTGVVDSMLHAPSPYTWGGGSVHRRSSSVSDACFGSDDPNGGGFGWKPCMYYARGYCKNGSSCRFLHGESMVGSDGVLVGSPNKLDLMDQCPELVRSRTAQQRLAAASQLMASSLPYSPKGINFLLQQHQNDPQRAAAALMMNDELHKFGRSRLDRNEMMNPASRQIYLTFPADSTFREEDVTNYFSIYGPVEDVRIPYQQKRMFGFVTFVYPDTVKIILAKGNPHFVCDARVLVKPYKEKGKVADKKQPQHQIERGEFSPCGTPTGMESRDPFDLQLGSRMFYNAPDILWRRKLEEKADLQQALELQSRRLMNLQLLDIKKHHHLRAFSTGSTVGSPIQSPNFFNQNIVQPPFHNNPEVSEESPYGSNVVNAINDPDKNWQKAVNAAACKEWTDKFSNGSNKDNQPNKDGDLQENLEHNLPDNLFASPTKASSEFLSTFSNPNGDAEKDATTAVTTTSLSAVNGISDNSSMPLASSPLEVSSFKSFNCQLPRFSSGHGAIGMSGGTGGPTCPVGI